MGKKENQYKNLLTATGHGCLIPRDHLTYVSDQSTRGWKEKVSIGSCPHWLSTLSTVHE